MISLVSSTYNSCQSWFKRSNLRATILALKRATKKREVQINVRSALSLNPAPLLSSVYLGPLGLYFIPARKETQSFFLSRLSFCCLLIPFLSIRSLVHAWVCYFPTSLWVRSSTPCSQTHLGYSFLCLPVLKLWGCIHHAETALDRAANHFLLSASCPNCQTYCTCI